MVLKKNYLATTYPNFSQIGRVAIDLELKMYVQLATIFISEIRKITFLRYCLASNENMTPKCPVSYILIDTREGSAFSNNRMLTGNM